MPKSNEILKHRGEMDRWLGHKKQMVDEGTWRKGDRRRELRQTLRRGNDRERCKRVAGGAEAIAGEIIEQQTEDTAEQNGKESSCVQSPPLLLLVTHIPIPRPANEREQDPSGVRVRNVQIEHEHSEQDGQHLLDIRYKKALA